MNIAKTMGDANDSPPIVPRQSVTCSTSTVRSSKLIHTDKIFLSLKDAGKGTSIQEELMICPYVFCIKLLSRNLSVKQRTPRHPKFWLWYQIFGFGWYVEMITVQHEINLVSNVNPGYFSRLAQHQVRNQRKLQKCMTPLDGVCVAQKSSSCFLLSCPGKWCIY